MWRRRTMSDPTPAELASLFTKAPSSMEMMRNMGTKTLLDLFCGAGGATAGYQRAGFKVVGVDIADHSKNYCGDDFFQEDAIDFLTKHGKEFDVIHASPPCQGYTLIQHRDGWPKLIPVVRELMLRIGGPYVIENVAGARKEMLNPIKVCGTAFDLAAHCRDGVKRELQRHRFFESNLDLKGTTCNHNHPAVGVYGTGGGGQQNHGYRGWPEEMREAMGIDWMTKRELTESIPPAYTEYLGNQIMGAI